MSSSLADTELEAALAVWQFDMPLTITRLMPVSGGTTSDTWYVDTASRRFVAKYSYWAQSTFESGLLAAEIVERHGIPSGAPVRTPAGALTVRVQDSSGQANPLALLRLVPGELLDLRDSNAPALMGSMLGQVHSILLREHYIPDTPEGPFAYINEDSDAWSASADLKALVGKAMDAVRDTDTAHRLTYGVISGDRLEVMVDSGTGRTGIVDWGVRYWGPLVADVASVALQFRQVGKTPEVFLRAYLKNAPLDPADLTGLWAYMALRKASGVKFYASCLAENATRGFSSSESIVQRLAASRSDLERLLLRKQALD